LRSLQVIGSLYVEQEMESRTLSLGPSLVQICRDCLPKVRRNQRNLPRLESAAWTASKAPRYASRESERFLIRWGEIAGIQWSDAPKRRFRSLVRLSRTEDLVATHFRITKLGRPLRLPRPRDQRYKSWMHQRDDASRLYIIRLAIERNSRR